MEIKLNKELQKKLDFFLKNKDEPLLEFSKIVGIGKLNYSIKELISFENKVKELLNEEKTAVLYNITCVYQNVLKFMFKQFVFN